MAINVSVHDINEGMALEGIAQGRSYFGSARKAPDIALDASELLLTCELWGNDFHLLDPTRDRVGELGFAYVPTGAVEEVFIDALWERYTLLE